MRVEQSSAASINNRVERVASHWQGICFSLMLAVSAVASLSAPQLGQTQIPPDGTTEDWDGDGVNNDVDLDDDNDGIIDSLEEVKTCDPDDLNGEIGYKYEQLPVLSYHRRLPISSDGTFTTVDEFGVPKLGNPTTDSSYTYNSNGSLVDSGNASGTDITNKLDLMRFDSKVFFPDVDPGTKIQIRLTASGPEDQSWWVISEDESLENWIDPVSDDHGPLLDMGGTVDYVPVSTADHDGVDLTTRPLGVNDSGSAQYRNRGFSEDFVAEITVSEAGHAFAIGIRDPQVSWGTHNFEYSPDGGQTWETADDFGTNDPCSFSLDNDYDRDGIVNSLDLDSDNDGISDLIEAGGVAASDIAALATSYPNGYYPTSTVSTNGVSSEANNGAGYAQGTYIDLDADDDGIPDAIEAQPTTGYVSVDESVAANNVLGIDKLYPPQDTDNDGIPDFLDTDSDDDGKSDSDEKGSTVNTDSSGPVTHTVTDGGYTPATDLENEYGGTNEVAYREVPPEVSISNTGTVSETVTITGTCKPNSATVTVSIEGVSPDIVSTCTDGMYSAGIFDIRALPDGTVTVTSTIEDSVGNTASATANLVVDNPVTVTITGPREGDKLTGPTETITGVCSPVGATVNVTLDPSGATPSPAPAICSEDGTYTVDVNTSKMPDGSATITSTIEDADGNKETATVSVNIDNPMTVTITGPREDDKLTGPTETITGVCWPAGATVNVTLDPSGATPSPAPAICSTDGTYTVDVNTSKMPNGSATITSTIEDADGNKETATVSVDIDNPVTVTITGPREDDNLTGPTETITGVCSPVGATVNVTLDPSGATPSPAPAICSEDGTYTVDVNTSKMPDGSATITSTIEDADGNKETATVSVDIDNPVTVTITGPREDDKLTGPTETITGVCSPVGATVNVTLDPSGATPSPAPAICSEDGTYTVDVNTSKMPDGSATITSTIEDADGNKETATVSVNIDNPVTVTITGPREDDKLTGPTETITGVCSPVGATVNVTLDPSGATPSPAPAICSEDGTYTVDVNTSKMPDGSATITSTIEDADGNKETATVSVNIDNPVTVTITGPREDDKLTGPTETITGVCSPVGATVNVTLDPSGATPSPAPAICSEDGTYTVDVNTSKMPDGSATITSTIEDADGNKETATVSVNIDNPVTVTITGPREDDKLTGPTETITGVCSPVGATVNVTLDPSGATPSPAPAICSEDGTYTVDVNTSKMPDGSATITSTIEDADGNKETATVSVNIDNPVTVTITGPREDDKLTGPTETITGVCSPVGATVNVTLDPSGATPSPAPAICSEDGTYTVDVNTSKMPDGSATITSTIEDADGNKETATVSVNIDNPVTVTITGPREDDNLTGPTETITGVCSPVGATVNVTLDPSGATPSPAPAICSEDGTYTVDVNTSKMPDGSATITSTIEDADGNKETATVSVNIDNPVTVTITGPREDDKLTGPTETITGVCSPVGATVNVTLDPSGATPSPAPAICSEDGTYTVDVNTSKMPDGSATITSTIEDADGNKETATVSVNIDNPVTVTITGPREDDKLTGPTETITGVCSPVGATVNVTLDPSGATPSPAPAICSEDGTYTVDVNTSKMPDGSATITSTIEDADGNKETATVSVNIDNPVTVTITGPREDDKLTGPTETITGVCSPVGATVNVTLDPSGATPSPAPAICSEDGTYTVDVNTSKMPDGSATITSTIEDADGNKETATVTVDIDNMPRPTDDKVDLGGGVVASINVLENDTLSTGESATTSNVDVYIVAPDGSTNSTTIYVPGEGTWTLTNGVIGFTPDAGLLKDPTPLVYGIIDKDSGTPATATVSIDYPPIAVDDKTDSVSVGESVTVSVIDNDIDNAGTRFDTHPDKDAAISGLDISLLNPDGTDGGTSVIIPGQGTYVLEESTGEITFTPIVGFTGDPTPIAYQFTDPDNNVESATLTIDYLAEPPVAGNDEAEDAQVGQSTTISILDNDILADSSSATNTDVAVDLDPTTPGVQTSLTVAGQGTWTYNSSTSTLVFTPESGFQGDPDTLTYTLIDTDNGATATATVVIDYQEIEANSDTVTLVGTQTLTGATDIINVLANDVFDDQTATTSTVEIQTASTTVTDANGDSVSGKFTLDADGSVDMAAETAAGTYTITYRICQIGNPNNCSTTSVTVVVPAPEISGGADSATVTGADALTGKTDVVSNVLDNDSIGGQSATTSNVTIQTASTTVTGPDGTEVTDVLTLGPDGSVDLAPNAPAGTYTMTYTICDKVSTDNCTTASVTVVVGEPDVGADEDSATVTGDTVLTGQTGVVSNVLDNDSIGGQSATTSNVTIQTASTTVTGPDGTEVTDVLTLNPDGSVDLAASAPAGTYTLTYFICDKVNPTNCESATVTIVVPEPDMSAVEDSATVTGDTVLTGQTGVVSNVLDNDSIGGQSATTSNVTIQTASTTVTGPATDVLTLNPDGSVDLAPNAPAGTYTLTYFICDKVNPTNCESATVTIVVPEPDVSAVEDSATVTGDTVLTGQTGVVSNVLDNDSIGGQSATTSNVTIQTASTTVTGPDGTEVTDVLTLNPDGSVDLAANAPAGTYELTYTICDVVNPSNCESATVSIVVEEPGIDAVEDSATVTGDTVLTGQTGVVSNVLDNDSIGGQSATTSNVTIQTASTTVTGPDGTEVTDVLTLNPDGSVDLAANAPAGTYELTYTICDVVNPSNCESATVSIVVEEPGIDAVEDSATVTGDTVLTGQTGVVSNVLDNDSIGGQSATTSNVTIQTASTTVTGPDGTEVTDVLTLNPDGSVDLAANAPAGTYELTYTICDVVNPSNCESATVSIVVEEPGIDAVEDSATVTGDTVLTGQTGVVSNVLDNDSIGGQSATTSNVTIQTASTTVTGPDGTEVTDVLTLNPDGSVDLAANAPAGTYELTYTICDVVNPSNCESATVSIVVEEPGIDAVEDTATVTGDTVLTGQTGIVSNVLDNDSIGGQSATTSNVTIQTASTTVTGPDGTEVTDVLTLNPDGSVDLAANAPAGTYELTYTICDVVNPSNCESATVSIVVGEPGIDAVEDSATVTGDTVLTGQTGVVSNVLDNDSIGGQSATTSNVTIQTASTTVTGPDGTEVTDVLTLNPDGSVDLAANAPAGTYELTYTICDVVNPSNCESATVSIVVEEPGIDAVEDSATVTGDTVLTGQTGVVSNVLDNDSIGGQSATTSNVTIQTASTTVTGPDGTEVTDVLTLNPDGSVDLAANAPAGTYELTYTICDVVNPSNCESATVSIVVEEPGIDAVEDTATVTGDTVLTGQTGVVSNVLDNDSIGGQSATTSNVTIQTASTTVTGPDGTEVTDVLTLNPDGSVDLAANAPAGTYELTYTICDVVNPSNCESATVSIVVGEPGIDAVEDSATVTGDTVLTGQTGVVSNVLDNDSIGGQSATTSNVTIQTASTTVTGPDGTEVTDVLTLNSDGSVDLAANAPAGTYELTYTICDVVNPSNCESATVSIVVEEPGIDAVEDSATVTGDTVLTGQTGVVSNVLDNDSIGGQSASTSNVDIQTASTTVTGPDGTEVTDVLTLNPDGSVDLAANAPAGTYELTYTICDVVNPSNCESATVSIVVEEPGIDAVEDSATVTGDTVLTGQTGVVSNVLANDSIGGQSATTSNVDIQTASTTVTGPDGTEVTDVLTLNPDGSVDLAANAPAGTYELTYTICDVVNPSNCESATVSIVVEEPGIDAVEDTATVTGDTVLTGQTGVVSNVLDNDSIGGQSATTSNVTIQTASTTVTGPDGTEVTDVLTLNPDGSVDLAANAPAGTYELTYTICDVVNPSNCESATVSIVVEEPGIDAVEDSATVTGDTVLTGQTGVVSNVLDNDSIGGQSATTSNVTIQTASTTVTGPDGTEVTDVLTLNPDGSVDLAANAPAGTYELTYTICDVVNPSNCESATVSIVVEEPGIDAVEDSATVTGDTVLTGQTGVVSNVLDNDSIGGQSATTSNVTIQTASTTVTGPDGTEVTDVLTLNPDGSVDLAANAPAGTYELTYTICDVVNPSNCESATVSIVVEEPAIDAVEDTVTVTGEDIFTGVTGVVSNVLDNDSIGGQSATISNVVIQTASTTVTGPDDIEVTGVLTLNVDGSVDLAANAPAGTYTLTYLICDVVNPSNCDSTTVTVIVDLSDIEASDDSVTVTGEDVLNGKDGVVESVLENDTVGSQSATTSNVVIQTVSTTVTGPVTDALTLNADGSIDLAANAPAGTYELTYTICEQLNPSNCDTAVVSVVVPEPEVNAEADAILVDADAVASGLDNVINVLENDTIAGQEASTATVAIQTVNTTVVNTDGEAVDGITLDADGNVDIIANMPVGSYTLTYEICDVINPSNCDTAIVTIIINLGIDPTGADNDGIQTTVEDAGPNSGDANDDGVADSTQPGVASLMDCPPEAGNCDVNDISDSTRDWVALDIVGADGAALNEQCRQIVNPYTTQESVSNIPGPDDGNGSNTNNSGTWNIGTDADYDYPLGLIGFAIECTDPDQEVAGIKSYFYGHQRLLDEGVVGSIDDYFIRKYADPTGSEDDSSIDDAQFQMMVDLIPTDVTEETKVNADGVSEKVLVITYALRDEKQGDSQRGQRENGMYRIFDPHGPAISVARFNLSKRANKSSVSVGDVVSYTLALENLGNGPANILVHDTPPAGLSILLDKVSTTKSGVSIKATQLDDGRVEFTDNGNRIRVDAKEKLTISYLAQISPGAVGPELSNSAVVRGSRNGDSLSNVAVETIKLGADPIFDLSTVVGKVYNDANGNGQQDAGELGLPGIRLATVSGEVIITDRHGRYHIPGLESDIAGNGKNYIIKLDTASLPSCAKVTSENPRVLRLTAGLMSRMDFAVDTGGQSIVEHEEKTTLVDTIYFANADDAISADQLSNLDVKLQSYLQDPNIRVRISGHTDSDKLRSKAYKDKYGDNYGLSQFRAQAVGRQIVRKLNIPMDRVEFVGYGPDRPIASNSTAAGQAKNRRVEVEIISMAEIRKQVGTCKSGSKGANLQIQRSQAATVAPVTQTTVKPVKATLTDVFFIDGTVNVKNPATMDKLIAILKVRGGTVTISSDTRALAVARAAILKRVVPAGVEVVIK